MKITIKRPFAIIIFIIAVIGLVISIVVYPLSVDKDKGFFKNAAHNISKIKPEGRLS
jgi:hypothetical protein